MKTLRPTVLVGVATALLLAVAMGAPGDAPPSPEKLIEQLGSKEFSERERATRLLQAGGKGVLPALRKAVDHPDAELEDAKGNRFEPYSWGTSRSAAHFEIQVGYRGPKGVKAGPPSNLIVEQGITLPHGVPFTFKDIPLP
jgi:hypothetical protein